METTSRFPWHGLMALVLAMLCTGCAALLDNTKLNEEADRQIASETAVVCRMVDELYAESVKLINITREENLNAEREKASARMLAEARDRYLAYVAIAKGVEEEDRKRLNDPSRYYEVISHKWPEKPKKTEEPEKQWGVQGGTRANWTLVMSGDGPLAENGLYRGVTFFSTTLPGRTEGLAAYAVVLTPVIPAANSRRADANNGDTETANLASMQGGNVLGPGSYRYPCRGYLRAKPGTTNLYAVRASTQLNIWKSTWKNDRQSVQSASNSYRCMSEALPYSPRSFSYSFSTPLAAYKGDIVAIVMPCDNYLAYTQIPKDAPDGTMKADSYYAITDSVVKAMAKGAAAAYGEGAVITLSPQMKFNGGRRAAFTFYGDYLVPGHW